MLSRHRISVTFVLTSLLGLCVLIGGLLSGCAAPGSPPVPTIQRTETPALVSTLPSVPPPAASPTASLYTDYNYTEYKTEHFTIYYTAAVSPTQVLTVSQYLEAAWREVPAFLEREPPTSSIRVYIGLPSTSGLAGRDVIVLRNDTITNDYAVIPHEFTHVLMEYSGLHWMDEGLAMYVQEQCPAGRYRAHNQIPVDSWSIGLLKANRWVSPWEFPKNWPLRDNPAAVFNELCTYWESGSFVKYLIETYGLSAFWKTYDDGMGWFAAEKVYGKSIDALIEEWRQHLADSTIPPEDCPDCILAFFNWADVEIQFYQHQDGLDTGIREQVMQELRAVYRAFDRKDAQAMQQHLEAARQLLEAESSQ